MARRGKKAAACHCIGRPNRFERGHCFTCGHTLGEFIDTIETDTRGTGQRAGAMALLAAVHRTQDKFGIRPKRLDMDLTKARRVVITPKTEGPSRALQTVRAQSFVF